MPKPIQLVLYGRGNCHLCDVAKAELLRIRRSLPFEIEIVERDVDTDPDWRNVYGDEVPVGMIDNRKIFKYRVDPDRLRAALISRSVD